VNIVSERMSVASLPGHIAINAVFLEPRMGGLDTMVRALVPELVTAAPGVRFSVFCNSEGRDYLRGEAWAAEADLVTHPLLGRRGLRAATELTLLGWLAPRHGAQLLHSVAMTAPLRTKAVNVVTVADVIWMLSPDPGEPYTTALWRAIVPPLARRADRVITISEAARRDLVEHVGVPADRVDVTLPGFGVGVPPAPTPEQELRSRLDLDGAEIVLTVSAKRVHKNLEALIRALPRVLAARPRAVLVLPGNPTPHEETLKELARRLGVHRQIRFLAYVSAEDLEGLYAAAACFVFPSLHEGFGLPVLEAMRRGVPVACSDASSLPEVAGDAAALFDPHDDDAIASAVLELLMGGEPVRKRVERGRARSARFTWARCAEQTLESYARAWAATR